MEIAKAIKGDIMTKIKIKENGKIEETNFSDYGDPFDAHFDSVETEDGDFILMTQEEFDWWADYSHRDITAREDLNRLLIEKPELNDDYLADVLFSGVEFNDYPEAIRNFVVDHN